MLYETRKTGKTKYVCGKKTWNENEIRRKAVEFSRSENIPGI